MATEELPGEFGGHHAPVDPRKVVVPRILAVLSQVLLTLVFIFGVAWTLWPTVWPANVSNLLGPNASTYGYLSVHASLAVALVVVELILITFVARLGRRPVLGLTVATFLLTVIAAVAGSLTLTQSAWQYYVLLMVLAFLGAWSVNLLVTIRLRWIGRSSRWRTAPPATAPPH